MGLLVVSLSIHEAAHAWAADRLGDPTARMLGRLTLNPLAHIDWIGAVPFPLIAVSTGAPLTGRAPRNPLAHIDWIGTVLFPLIAFSTGAPLIGWAKPVPVSMLNLKAPRRD